MELYYLVTVFPLQIIVLILTSILTPQNLTKNVPYYPNVQAKETHKLRLTIMFVPNFLLFHELLAQYIFAFCYFLHL